MVKNTKTWISLERNVIFLRNQKILNLCITWHILRSYGFVAEVTFKGIVTAELLLELKICSSDEMLPRFKICSSDETPLKLKICSIGSSDETRWKRLIKTWWKTFLLTDFPLALGSYKWFLCLHFCCYFPEVNKQHIIINRYNWCNTTFQKS